MESQNSSWTKEEIRGFNSYFRGTPSVYRYCYKNSPEFKSYADSFSKKDKRWLKLAHLLHYISFSFLMECVIHFMTFGITLVIKKYKERKKLKEAIETEEFKMICQALAQYNNDENVGE